MAKKGLARKRRTLSPLHRERIREANTGHQHSPTTKLKITLGLRKLRRRWYVDIHTGDEHFVVLREHTIIPSHWVSRARNPRHWSRW